jgi:hypothetical protein
MNESNKCLPKRSKRGAPLNNKRAIGNRGHVFALTRGAFEWRTLGIGEKELADKVARLRAGLELDRRGGPAPLHFDLALAHELYGTLIGPVESLVKEKHYMVAVPSGPLASLPLSVLVTEAPPRPMLEADDAALSRSVDWLIKRHAVSVLPSVASLKALRFFARYAAASRPMVGFGDPVFDPAERATALAQRGAGKASTVSRGGPMRLPQPPPGGGCPIERCADGLGRLRAWWYRNLSEFGSCNAALPCRSGEAAG